MVREKSEFIGEVAMQQVSPTPCGRGHLSWLVYLTKAARNYSLDLAQEVKKPLTSERIDPDGCAQDVVDFSPVYRGLHIHSVLVGCL